MIRVLVLTVKGDSLELDADAQGTIREIKGRVADCWQIPCSCQKLACGGTILRDLDVISDCLALDSSAHTSQLHVTLVVSLEEALLALDSPSGAVRAEGLSILSELRGRDVAIEAICHHMEDGNAYVRYKAVKALSKVAERGHEGAIACAIRCLQSEDLGLKNAALEVLGVLSKQGDMSLMEKIYGHLNAQDAGLRMAAAEALGDVAPRGNADAVTALSSLLRDPDGVGPTNVRVIAVHSLTRVAEKDDESVMDALCACLLDKNYYVRDAAADALVALASTGNHHLIASVAKHLSHRSPDVQQLTIRILTQMVMQEDGAVVMEMSKLVEQKDELARCAAAEIMPALSIIVGPNHVAGVLLLMLEDGSVHVRRAAAEAIFQMECAQPDVRLAAMETLRSLQGRDGMPCQWVDGWRMWWRTFMRVG